MTKKARLCNARKTISSTNGAGKTAQPQIKKMKLDHSLTPCTKISSTWIKYLNVRPDTLKLLEENTGRTLSHINHRNIFSNLSLRIMEIKTKINKWNLIKLKNLHGKGNNKENEKATHRFANDVTMGDQSPKFTESL